MGREEIFIDLGSGAPKTPIVTGNWLKFGFSLSSPLATPMLDGLRTSDPEESTGYVAGWPRGGVVCGGVAPWGSSLVRPGNTHRYSRECDRVMSRLLELPVSELGELVSVSCSAFPRNDG